MNNKQQRFLTQIAAARSGKTVVFLCNTNFGHIGSTLAVSGRTSTYLHPSRQGWVAVTPRGREIVILDSAIQAGLFQIKES
jgi:hypothetical protein